MATPLATLERHPASVPDSLWSELQALGQRAASELGYARLSTLSEQAAQGYRLRSALSALGIAPLTPESVSRYQQQIVAADRRPWAWALRGCGVMFVGAGPGLVGAARAAPPGLAVLAMVVGLVGLIGVIYIASKAYASDTEPIWRRSSLRDLSATAIDVPAFALQTALALRKAVPGCGLSVEYFLSRAERARQRPRVEDPFLVVQLGDYEAYVEVWDEPGFEQARKV